MSMEGPPARARTPGPEKKKGTPPPQTQPERLDPTLAERAVESKVQTATRVGKETLGKTKEKIAEALPHSVVGDAWASAQRMGLNIIGKPVIARFERLYQKQNLKSIKAEVKYSNAKQVVDALHERRAELDRLVEGLRNRPQRDANAEQLADKEKRELSQKIKKAEALRDKASGPLRDLNDMKATWENAQKKFVERMLTSATEKMSPYTKRFEALQSRRGEITNDLARYTKLKEEGTAGIQGLEAALKNKDTFKFERPALKEKIKAIKKLLKEAGTQESALKKENEKLAGRLGKVQTRLGKWEDWKNEKARVTHRERRYVHPERESVSPDLRRRGYSFDTQPEGTPAVHDPSNEPEREALETTATPQAYVSTWNELFKAEVALDPKEFERESRLRAEETMPAEAVEEALKKYIKKAMREGTVRYMSDAVLEERFARIRKRLGVEHDQNKKESA